MKINGKITAVIAARMNSSRMYGKSMAILSGIPSLEHIIKRVKASSYIDNIVIATTEDRADDEIRNCAVKNGVYCFSGSENDVLDRTVRAAKMVNTDYILIVNGDSPIIAPKVIDRVILGFFNKDADYASNSWAESWPKGTEAEICKLSILEFINLKFPDPIYHEHVTLAIHENRKIYKVVDIIAPQEETWPQLRLTLDTEEDYNLISRIYNALYEKDNIFGIDKIIAFFRLHPELLDINKRVKQKPVRE